MSMPSFGGVRDGTQGFVYARLALSYTPTPVIVWLCLVTVFSLGLALCFLKNRKERRVH